MKSSQTPRLRLLLLDDNQVMRSVLNTLLSNRGWEVLSYPGPEVCPLRSAPGCTCKRAEVRADALVTDFDMPHINGLTFARELLQKGCKIPNLALLTESQDSSALAEARSLGFAVFHKSTELIPLLDWLCYVEAHLIAERQLAHWVP